MITKTLKGYKITSGFGSIDDVHLTPHTGIDISMETGTELISPISGVVERVINYGSENVGKGLVIRGDNGEQVIFGHLSDWKVKLGDHIDKGDLIALSGNTGHSTGPHVHLGLVKDGQFADPSKYLDAGFNFDWFFTMKDWAFHKIVGDPTGVISIAFLVGLLIMFKPTRIYTIAGLFLYLILI